MALKEYGRVPFITSRQPHPQPLFSACQHASLFPCLFPCLLFNLPFLPLPFVSCHLFFCHFYLLLPQSLFITSIFASCTLVFFIFWNCLPFLGNSWTTDRFLPCFLELISIFLPEPWSSHVFWNYFSFFFLHLDSSLLFGTFFHFIRAVPFYPGFFGTPCPLSYFSSLLLCFFSFAPFFHLQA